MPSARKSVSALMNEVLSSRTFLSASSKNRGRAATVPSVTCPAKTFADRPHYGYPDCWNRVVDASVSKRSSLASDYLVIRAGEIAVIQEIHQIELSNWASDPVERAGSQGHG